MDNWKKHHAEESGKALNHELVQEVMQQYALNMGFELRGLPAYGLKKVAIYAAQVARAQALGFDPNLLLLTDEEADQQMLRLARLATEHGIPTWAINEEDLDEPEE